MNTGLRSIQGFSLLSSSFSAFSRPGPTFRAALGDANPYLHRSMDDRPPTLTDEEIFYSLLGLNTCSHFLFPSLNPRISDMAVHDFNPATWRQRQAGTLSSRTTWSRENVPSHPGLHGETMSRDKTNKPKTSHPTFGFDEVAYTVAQVSSHLNSRMLGLQV